MPNRNYPETMPRTWIPAPDGYEYPRLDTFNVNRARSLGRAAAFRNPRETRWAIVRGSDPQTGETLYRVVEWDGADCLGGVGSFYRREHATEFVRTAHAAAHHHALPDYGPAVPSPAHRWHGLAPTVDAAMGGTADYPWRHVHDDMMAAVAP